MTLINLLALRKVLSKYKLTPENKQQVVLLSIIYYLLSKLKTATWTSIHRLARKIEFQQTLNQQEQKQQH